MKNVFLSSFRDLDAFVSQKINEVEERFHGALGDVSKFERVLASQKDVHLYQNPIRALQVPAVGIYFNVKDDVGQEELVLGVNNIGSRTVFADLNGRDANAYNAAVVLQPRRRTLIASTGYEGREFVSSFGRLYGEGDNVGCRWLNFQSNSYCGLGLEPQLICATVNHGPVVTTDYWGFRFRAVDLGNGNLTALVQHLLLP